MILNIHLALGYVPWLLCFAVYIWPRLRSMEPIEAQRVIATLHSFRFFGLVFIVPGVVGPNLPAGFTEFAAYDARPESAEGRNSKALPAMRPLSATPLTG